MEDRHLRKVEATGSNPVQSIKKISDESIGEYLSFLELKGVTKGHLKEVERYIENYKKYILSDIDKQKSIEYFKELHKNNSIAYYKRQMFQLRRFLKFLNIDWANEIILPADPHYEPIRLTTEKVQETLNYFRNDKSFVRLKAVILLGCTSGIRAEELYKLSQEDIVLEENKVIIRHDPKSNHSTKNKKSRISYFSSEAKLAIIDYLDYFNNQTNSLNTLFAQKTISRKFCKAPIRVKHLRKYFSQQWDRRGGPTGTKRLLMGHSTRNDVDLQHYNAQSEEDLKRIYDNVMLNPL